MKDIHESRMGRGNERARALIDLFIFTATFPLKNLAKTIQFLIPYMSQFMNEIHPFRSRHSHDHSENLKAGSAGKHMIFPNPSPTRQP